MWQKNKEIFPFFWPVEANVQGMCLSDREASGESLSLNRFMIQNVS